MKKILSMMMAICVMAGVSVTAFAHNINNNTVGISLSLSDNWANDRDDDIIAFHYSTNEWEEISIIPIEMEFANSIDMIEESLLREYCDDYNSNSNLADGLIANTAITIKTDSVVTKYETYNGVKYYRYEKAYTATAYGYYPKACYVTTLITAKNGKMYVITYNRDYNENHFKDFAAMMNSISYDPGTIKIELNDRRIYPDSDPMIVDDRTLVPIRAIAEAMGYSVSWDGEEQIVTMVSSDGGTVLHFGIGYNEALKNYDEEIPLDVPAIIYADRTYLPLRAVAEAMDAEVNWDGNTKTVDIWY